MPESKWEVEWRDQEVVASHESKSDVANVSYTAELSLESPVSKTIDSNDVQYLI